MVKAIVFVSAITFAFVALGSNPKKELILSQKQVAELALSQSPKAQEINFKYEQLRLGPALALSAYDWRITADSGYDFDKSLNLMTSFTQNNNKYDRYKTTIGLQKPLTTGTTLGFEISRLSQKSQYDSNITTPPPTVQTLDSFGLTIEQSLLGNFWGTSDKSTLQSAELNLESNKIIRNNELEDVVLQAIRQFWQTYVAQENYKEAMNSRDRYKKLVDAIKKKTSLGYSNPGDLPQVQAELEIREQKVKLTLAEFLSQSENLATLLKLEPNTEIKFDISRTLNPSNDLPKKNIEELREIRSQKLKVAASDEVLKSAESTGLPTLNFVGKAYSYGVDPSSDDSFTQMASINRPKYYAGIKFQYNFGSDYQAENINSKKNAKNLEESRLQRQILEMRDREEQTERKVKTAFEVAQSTERQRAFREKAAQELNTSYNQGRTDISVFINALNNFFDSEILYTKAIADYAVAVSEWAAFRDELISDDALK